MREKIRNLFKKVDAKFLEQFGFNIRNVTFDKIVDYMHTPKDASSLAVTRILFGFAMLLDILGERGGTRLVRLWGDPKMCHFPLIPSLQPMPLPYMALVYLGLWIGATGIMLGYKYSVTAPLYTTCYWYLFLIEKSLWNNHSYLFGLVALLFSCTDAACYWSMDAYLNPSKKKQTVPYWNYFVLKYQFFILYFMAGMKKSGPEWLTGYSLPKLSEHWVFTPFKYFLTVPQMDFLIVHAFVFAFDLTVAVWMMWARTRHVAMLFCALFHLMNSRLFRIGMFPWVCLATMPLFYPFDWPKRVAYYYKKYYTKINNCVQRKIAEFILKNICKCSRKESDVNKDNTVKEREDEVNEKFEESFENNLQLIEKSKRDDVTDKTKELTKLAKEDIDWDKEERDSDPNVLKNVDEVAFKGTTTESRLRKKTTVYLIACYVFIQAFLPYSHFITKGYNNWTDGLYGYSWDMMVHTWNDLPVAVTVVDNDRNQEIFIDPEQFTLSTRWSKHGDMVYQYAHCLKRNLEIQVKEVPCDNPLKMLSKNISIYIDVWLGLNGRFTQRLFDPKADLLKANWSPFRRVPYLMPLLDEALHWRKDLAEIKEEVYSWSNNSDVFFFADFPGFALEKYIPPEVKNVTLTILEGTIVYEPEVPVNQIGRSFKFTTNDHIKVNYGMHKLTNIGTKPAYYMYTFYSEPENTTNTEVNNQNLSVTYELYKLFYSAYFFGNSVLGYLFEMLKFSQCNN